MKYYHVEICSQVFTIKCATYLEIRYDKHSEKLTKFALGTYTETTQALYVKLQSLFNVFHADAQRFLQYMCYNVQTMMYHEHVFFITTICI